MASLALCCHFSNIFVAEDVGDVEDVEDMAVVEEEAAASITTHTAGTTAIFERNAT
jgi:hypothetical protein